MIWPPDPKSWSEFPAECCWYLFPLAPFLHIFAFIASLGALMIFRMVGVRGLRFSTIILYHGYLLIAAMIANGVWSCAIWGRLYWSVDYTSDFSPFYPITKGVICYSWGPNYSGGLNGLTLTELNMVWLVFALGTWLSAFFLTRWTCRPVRRRIGEQDAPEQPQPAAEFR